MRFVAPLAVMMVLAACAPATTGDRYDQVEGSRVFTLTVDGQDVPASRGVYTYRTRDYEIDVRLNRVSFDFELVNTSGSTMRLNLDRSTIVLPGGSRSRVATSGTGRDTPYDPQSTFDIPPGAVAMGDLLPRSLFRSDRGGGGLPFDPMFEWPLASPVTIRLLLSVEIGGSEREIVLVFEGTPPQQRAAGG